MVSSKIIETRLYIHGKFVSATSGRTFQVISPGTNKSVAEVCEADEEDVDKAVQSAKRALPYWSSVDGGNTRMPIPRSYTDSI